MDPLIGGRFTPSGRKRWHAPLIPRTAVLCDPGPEGPALMCAWANRRTQLARTLDRLESGAAASERMQDRSACLSPYFQLAPQRAHAL